MTFRYEEIPLRLNEEMSVNGLISTILGEFINRTYSLGTQVCSTDPSEMNRCRMIYHERSGNSRSEKAIDRSD